MPAASIVHRWEEAGYGKAPFRVVRYYEAKFCACPGAPVQPGASCDICGTGIMGVYVIRSADGREFKTGCECVKKSGDRGLVDTVKREANRKRTEARHKREAEQIEVARRRLAVETVRRELTAQPHPRSPEAYGGPDWKRQDYAPQTLYFVGKTRLDWAEWMLAHAGNQGRLEVARYLEQMGGPNVEL